MSLRKILLLFFAVALTAAARDDVRVWEGTLTLPTYEEGQPDPNPPFDIFQTTRFSYPYTLRENLTNRRVDYAWRAVYLENEYLKCSVLPDIGGHVYTCIDKISGKPMFYANPSIKKAQIGYRGAWAAFGIEFNFPVSHNWVSMSPVAFAYRKNNDGSASVTVGNIDRVYGMEWNVELTLRPGSTVLEEHVALSNRSDVRHRFYWWNNAAVEVWDDSKIEYPMRYAASHGFTEVRPWPVGPDGKDLSIIRNQLDGPVSYFVHGSREPFMGIWNPHTNTGTVHFAEYPELPAKKIWSWGVDADGLDWRKALSDNDSAYAEVQAGLFRNQETYAFLEPRQTIRFSEYWMPVRDSGGIARANLSGVVNLTREGGKLHAVLNVNHRIDGATVRILEGDRVVSTDTVGLVPEHTWKREIPAADSEHRYTFELKDSAGTTLLRHTEGQYDWTPTDQIHVGSQSQEQSSADSEDHWLQAGKDEELNGNLPAALAAYQSGLSAFAKSFALNKAAGRLTASLLRYEDALHYLEPAQARNTSDAEISYYLGIAYDGLDQARQAQTAFEAAHRMPQFKSAGSLHLAELLAREGNLQQASRYLKESLAAAPDDVRTAEELVAVARALRDENGGRALAQEFLNKHPLSYFLREELGHPDVAALGADPYRVLSVASEYMRLGLYGPALQVLSRNYPAALADQSEPETVPPQSHVLIAYYRAYCQEKLGGPAAAEYRKAAKLSTAYVFPDSAQTLAVLNAALKANPSDGTAQYLLGTLLFSRGLTDAALEHWNRARELSPKIPVLHADIGNALLHIRRDAEGAAAAFREGVTIDPKNPVLYNGLDQSLSVLNRPATDRIQALESYPDLAHMPSNLIYELALSRAEAGDFDGAEGLFQNRFFAREEGGTNVRQVWVEVLLLKALSLQRAGNCDAAIKTTDNLAAEVPGLAFTKDGLTPILESARIQYLLGSVDTDCGQRERAQVHFEDAVNKTEPGQLAAAYAAAKKLGKAEASEWKPKLEAALAKIESNSRGSAYSSYTTGSIEAALGHTNQAVASFKQAMLLPDRLMAWHLSRLARAGL